MNWNALPNEYVGVIGTLLGTILGWTLNKLSQLGRLRIYPYDWEDEFSFINKMGEEVDARSIEEAQTFLYRITLDIYNGSAESRIMRDITVCFVSKDGQQLFSDKPKNDATKRRYEHFTLYDDLEFINLAPKSVATLHLHGVWGDRDKPHFDDLAAVTQVILLYKNEKNRQKTITLHDGELGTQLKR